MHVVRITVERLTTFGRALYKMFSILVEYSSHRWHRIFSMVLEKWFRAGTQDFSNIKELGAFADHTLLIKHLLIGDADDGIMDYEPVLITAPSNLSVVKYRDPVR